MPLNNWSIGAADGVALTATTTSVASAIASTPAAINATDVMIDNPGPSDVYVKSGGSDAVATVNSMRVPANSLQPFFKGSGATHLAIIVASGTQAIVVHCGVGL